MVDFDRELKFEGHFLQPSQNFQCSKSTDWHLRTYAHWTQTKLSDVVRASVPTDLQAARSHPFSRRERPTKEVVEEYNATDNSWMLKELLQVWTTLQFAQSASANTQNADEALRLENEELRHTLSEKGQRLLGVAKDVLTRLARVKAGEKFVDHSTGLKYADLEDAANKTINWVKTSLISGDVVPLGNGDASAALAAQKGALEALQQQLDVQAERMHTLQGSVQSAWNTMAQAAPGLLDQVLNEGVSRQAQRSLWQSLQDKLGLGSAAPAPPDPFEGLAWHSGPETSLAIDHRLPDGLEQQNIIPRLEQLTASAQQQVTEGAWDAAKETLGQLFQAQGLLAIMTGVGTAFASNPALIGYLQSQGQLA